MSTSKIGINFDNFGDMTPINITFPTTRDELLTQLPQKANEHTGGYFGLITSLGMFVYLFWLLSDKTEFGDFRYSTARAMGISAGIVSIFGYIGLVFGFFTSFYHIALFMLLFGISIVWTWYNDR